MAEEELNLIPKWRREGIDVALKYGVPFGQPKAQITEDFREVYGFWKAGKKTAVNAIAELGSKKITF